MPTAARLNDVAVRVRLEGREVFCGDQNHVPAVATATAVWAATRLVLLAVK
jgi:tRNA-binding EMAP/Myf-like protein